VKQVLTFARGVEGERVKLFPKHVMREMEEIALETFPRNIQIRSEIPKDLWAVRGDATQIHQVLLNLCINARDAMPDGGILTLRGENLILDGSTARTHQDAKPGPYVVMSVIDTGTGIPPEEMDKIFDPFFTTKDLGKGTGLGLSTALAVVRGHGGFVMVYSEVGHGSTFKAYFPAVDTIGAMQQEQSPYPLPRGAGETVLVIDDEIPVLDITREALEAYGYRVKTARDGAEGVTLYAQQRGEIDIVLTDMMMPFMDGEATIRTLCRIDPSVKIIASSGLMDDGKSFESVKPLICSFLAKPWDAESLLRTLQTALARPSK
jgi:two-component system cell cycle sensor histidine kinase/response regulator CckA